jgi:hypothetical protein
LHIGTNTDIRHQRVDLKSVGNGIVKPNVHVAHDVGFCSRRNALTDFTDPNAGNQLLLGYIPGLVLLGNLGPGKAEGVLTTNSGGGPDLICSGFFEDVIKAIRLPRDDAQRVLVEVIVTPLYLHVLIGQRKPRGGKALRISSPRTHTQRTLIFQYGHKKQ